MYYLIYHLFGKDNNQMKSELLYSLFSFDKVTGENNKQNILILIYTDVKFDLPNSLGKLRIKFQYLDEKDVQHEILRANGCHFIIKAIIIAEFLQTFKSYGIFIDTDTFFTRDPIPLFRSVAEGFLLMHVNEYPISQSPNVYSYFKREIFKNTEGADYSVKPDFDMWNAGVIGISPTYEKYLPEIICLIRQMAFNEELIPAVKRLIEQISFSYYLQKHPDKLLPSDEYIFHYWFFKETRYLLGNHFNYFYGSDYSEFINLLNDNNIKLHDLNDIPYEGFPFLIFRMLRKHGELNDYHYKSLPPSSTIGKILRSAQ